MSADTAAAADSAAGRDRAGISLTVRRVFRAAPERVFDAWTDPALLARWWGPDGTGPLDPRIDLRVGGEYRLDMRGEDSGKVYRLRGRYVEIDRPARLAFTWEWLDADNSADGETLVELDFRAVDGGTELTLTHTGFANDSRRAAHEEGWTSSLGCLERAVD